MVCEQDLTVCTECGAILNLDFIKEEKDGTYTCPVCKKKVYP